jgi:hypothetical protein
MLGRAHDVGERHRPKQRGADRPCGRGAEERPDRLDQRLLTGRERRAIDAGKDLERRSLDQRRDVPVAFVVGPLTGEDERRHVDRRQDRPDVGSKRRVEELACHVRRDEVALHLREPPEEVAVDDQ